MKIEILKSCVGFNISFKRGDVCEVDDKIGRDLVNAKFAKKITAATTKAAATETAKPETVKTATKAATKTAKAPTPETAKAAETVKTETATAAAAVTENGGEANADA